ncbi:MAG: terminase, partial [Smithella sp.]
QIVGRNCYITVASMQKPNASRTFAYQMAHLSELAFWKKTEGKEPKDVIQSIRSCILNKKNTIIIQESTAKGTGNFWYQEWQASISGKSGYYPLFIGFWEIELYEEKILNYSKFIHKMNGWEPEKRKRALWMWSIGATLEAIKWYFNFMERENYDEWRMMSEFPATAEEAFQSTGSRVFPPEDVDRMRKTWVCKPSFVGDITGDADTGVDALKGINFVPNEQGCFKVWDMPDLTKRYKNRYLVSVDIGGTTKDADNSVIRVFDRLPILSGGGPEVIATWAGHLPQDMIAWLAARIAMVYDNALLVVESNSLRTEKGDGDHFLTVLNEIKEFYDNLYCRTSIDKIREGKPAQYGFHTNQQTKPMVISGLRTAFRTGGYVDYDDETLVECDQYELKDNGEYGAVDGAKDDRVMCTAIGLWVCMNNMDPISEVKYSVGKRITQTAGAGESRF